MPELGPICDCARLWWNSSQAAASSKETCYQSRVRVIYRLLCGASCHREDVRSEREGLYGVVLMFAECLGHSVASLS